jgi:DNA-binding NtrC family response regulator
MIAAHPALIGTAAISETVICLVDDDSSVRKSISRLLESAGHRVAEFDKPETFLRHLARNRVSLVILDIWSKPEKAMELLSHLSATSPGTRVIFISGSEGSSSEHAIRKAGAFAWFRKPLDNVTFLAAVRSALN